MYNKILELQKSLLYIINSNLTLGVKGYTNIPLSLPKPYIKILNINIIHDFQNNYSKESVVSLGVFTKSGGNAEVANLCEALYNSFSQSNIAEIADANTQINILSLVPISTNITFNIETQSYEGIFNIKILWS